MVVPHLSRLEIWRLLGVAFFGPYLLALARLIG